MNDAYKNTLVLLVLVLLVGGAGAYYVYLRLPGRIDRLEKRHKTLRLAESNLSDLFEEQAASRKKAERMKVRWNSRYKTIPDTLRTTEVVKYLNERTREGFENITINLRTRKNESDYKRLIFRVRGKAFFAHLYSLIWQIEQRRKLFRISNLKIQHQNVTQPAEDGTGNRRFIMTKFSFVVKAYFGAISGVSAPKKAPAVPAQALPPASPNVNPFYPVVKKNLPPNSRDRINVEKDELIAIVGEQAGFRRKDSVRQVQEGDPVYLGTITEVNPKTGQVIAQLNKGGIYDRVVLHLNEGDLTEQARGDAELSAIENESGQ